MMPFLSNGNVFGPNSKVRCLHGTAAKSCLIYLMIKNVNQVNTFKHHFFTLILTK